MKRLLQIFMTFASSGQGRNIQVMDSSSGQITYLNVMGQNMKNVPLFLCLLLSSCSGLDRPGLKSALNNNSYHWHISNADTSFAHIVHFFQDSIFVLEVKDPEDTSAYETGNWQVKSDLLNPSLWVSNRLSGSDIEFTLKSKRDGTLNFVYKIDHFWDPKRSYRTVDKKHRIKAVQIKETKGKDIAQYLVGSWNDPTDSIFAPFSEWQSTGNLLANPSFIFTKDSFDIRTEGYKKKGTYRIVNFGRDLVILESERVYCKNWVAEIDYIDSTEIRFQLDKKYRLKRNGP